MLKLELTKVSQKDENGKDLYGQPLVEFDYSNLREIRRDTVVTEFEYNGEKHSSSKVYVTFGEGLTVDYSSTYLGDGDSIGHVAVWDPVKKEPVWFGLGYENGVYEDGTRLGPNRFVTYDATPEVQAEYKEYKAEQERIRIQAKREREEAARKEHEAYMAAEPTKGKMVRVVKGRKIPIGTVGKVFWYGTTDTVYGRQTRVGLEVVDVITGAMKLFTNRSNVEVLTESEVA